MPRVIGYTYMSACHCPGCTLEAVRIGQLLVNNYHTNAVALSSSPAGNLDEHGIHFNNADSEGNLIHPMLDTDEVLDRQSCDDCGGLIREDVDITLLRWKQGHNERDQRKALDHQMSMPWNGKPS